MEQPPYKIKNRARIGKLEVESLAAPTPLGANRLIVADDTGLVKNASELTEEGLQTFIDSAGQPGGLATLDENGKVPTDQLENGGGVTIPNERGVLLTSDGTTARSLSVGDNGKSLISDSSQLRGLKYDYPDHTTLYNRGNYTHTQIDAFMDSAGQADGLATLDTDGDVPLTQLGKVEQTTAITSINTQLEPLSAWDDPSWLADLQSIKNTGTEIPIYSGVIDGTSYNTYFVDSADVADHPFILELVFKNSRTISLLVDGGDPIGVPISGTYRMPVGTYNPLLLPAPVFSIKTIAAGAYSDKWDGTNNTNLATASQRLSFLVSAGFPDGPTLLPTGSPFSTNNILDANPYLDTASVPVQIRGWRTT